MLFPRLITILIGIPIILYVIYWGGIPFLLFILGVTTLGLREYLKFVKKGGYLTNSIVGQVCGILFLLSIYLNKIEFLAVQCNQGTAMALSFIILVLFLAEFFRSELNYALLRVGITLLGIMLIVWTIGHLILIREIRPLGMQYTFFLFLVIWAVDISAYATGYLFGKHKLYPKISPHKTVEGFLGGIVFGIIIAVIVYLILLRKEFTLTETILLSFFIAIMAQLSDLIESLVKRSVGVKDSSTLLPGHGGILDRFDSFIFSAPLFFYYLTLFH
ncbi:MAG: phosphatidate cytidylyltransferase [bacterium]